MVDIDSPAIIWFVALVVLLVSGGVLLALAARHGRDS